MYSILQKQSICLYNTYKVKFTDIGSFSLQIPEILQKNAYKLVLNVAIFGPCRFLQREPIWGHRAGESMLPAVFALLSWRRYYQGSCSTSQAILPLNDYENVLKYYFFVYRSRGPASLGRIQAGALSCWTCGEPTIRPTAPPAHLHLSSARPPLPVGLNTLPGCPGIPTAAPAAGYQRYVWVHILVLYMYFLIQKPWNRVDILSYNPKVYHMTYWSSSALI